METVVIVLKWPVGDWGATRKVNKGSEVFAPKRLGLVNKCQISKTKIWQLGDTDFH